MDKNPICERCGGFMQYDSENIYKHVSLLCIMCGNVKEIDEGEINDNKET